MSAAALAFCRHGFRPGSGLCPYCSPPPAPEKAEPSFALAPARQTETARSRRGDTVSRGKPRLQLTGQTLAGVTVVREAPTTGSGSRWLVRCAAGHESTAMGAQLRHLARHRKKHPCPGCRAQRRGA